MRKIIMPGVGLHCKDVNINFEFDDIQITMTATEDMPDDQFFCNIKLEPPGPDTQPSYVRRFLISEYKLDTSIAEHRLEPTLEDIRGKHFKGHEEALEITKLLYFLYNTREYNKAKKDNPKNLSKRGVLINNIAVKEHSTKRGIQKIITLFINKEIIENRLTAKFDYGNNLGYIQKIQSIFNDADINKPRYNLYTAEDGNDYDIFMLAFYSIQAFDEGMANLKQLLSPLSPWSLQLLCLEFLEKNRSIYNNAKPKVKTQVDRIANEMNISISPK